MKSFIQTVRKWWTGKEEGCWFFHEWDDAKAATRTCTKCGDVQVMSHL